MSAIHFQPTDEVRVRFEEDSMAFFRVWRASDGTTEERAIEGAEEEAVVANYVGRWVGTSLDRRLLPHLARFKEPVTVTAQCGRYALSVSVFVEPEAETLEPMPVFPASPAEIAALP